MSGKIGVALVPQYMGVEWGMARLMGVAKAELNNSVHLCSNKGCTVDFTSKPVHPPLPSACVLAKVVVFKAKLNNTVHLCSN